MSSGTGVVAITAARIGAKAIALDLIPELLERARYNSQIAGLEVDWQEGDVEEILSDDGYSMLFSASSFTSLPSALHRHGRRCCAS